jgi:U3 small nucleolar RNA-associated protein 16
MFSTNIKSTLAYVNSRQSPYVSVQLVKMAPVTIPRSGPLVAPAGSDDIDLSSDGEPDVQESRIEILQNSASSLPGKLPVRVKSRTSGKHRSLDIEIPIPKPSGRERNQKVKGSQDGDEGGHDDDDNDDEFEEVFQTPMERRHIRFDDEDHDVFVTPLESRPKSALDTSSVPRPTEDENEDPAEEVEEEEEDDDDAPPEAVSSRHAAAQLMKSTQAAAKAAEQ